jgi:hypothetical protein
MALPLNGSVKLWLALLHELELAGGVAKPGQIIPGMRRYFPEITDDDLTRVNPKTGQLTWENRVHWARQDLVYRGLIDGSTHGVWRITLEGTQWLQRHWLGADAYYGDVLQPPKIEGQQRARAIAPPRPTVQAFRSSGLSLHEPPVLGAGMGRVVARAVQGTDTSLDCLDYYLVACMGHELGNFGDALRLLDRALASGLDGNYRAKAEQLRAVCMLKVEA